MIGIATVARPEEEGIRNDSGRNSTNTTIAKPASPTSPTACSAQCRTVSVICPLFMTTVMPRAMPMISATPSRSRAPSTNAFVSSSSRIRPMTPMMMLNRMNDAVISGNHHHSVGRPMPEVLPRDDAVHHHAEGQPEHDQDRLVAAGHDAPRPRRPTLKCASFASRMLATSDRLGSFFTRSA